MFKLTITCVIDDGNGDIVKKTTHECLTFEGANALQLEISKCVKGVLESHITR